MKILIIGGCGFTGSRLADKLLNKKDNLITIFDNLSKRNVFKNYLWLVTRKRRTRFLKEDVADFFQVRKAMEGMDIVYNFAKNRKNPREEFETEYLGTFNILESARISKDKLIYLSCKGIVKKFAEKFAQKYGIDVKFI